MKFAVIDGYVDEPTCLGVPPFISTYVRYAAGAARTAGALSIDYITIEDLRQNDYNLTEKYGMAAIIAGNPVPGKYLGGVPMTAEEAGRIGRANPGTVFLLGGPVRFSGSRNYGCPNIIPVRLDIEPYIYSAIRGENPVESLRTLSEIELFSKAGAFIAGKHPRFPDVIAEIETGRGCPRKSHCSFCVEGGYSVVFREPGSVISEIRELNKAGVMHFRIGKQADLFAYGSLMNEWRNGFPKPDVDSIRRLYEGIRDAVPDIKTLHLDNVNPGTVSNYPDESFRISEIISKNNTPGDVAAFGMESADPAVIHKNCLKAYPEDVMKAIEIVNEAGGWKDGGLPKLLPGINLIRGLPGESRETFKMNYEFLKEVLDKGFLLRRINIRQLRVSGGTKLGEGGPRKNKEEKILDAVFRNYREKIRRDVDVPMIRKVFGPGTLFNNVIVETRRGDWSIARPIGTYPIAVNIPKILPIHSKANIFVTGYRERSLIGLVAPFAAGNASLLEIRQIPGFSKSAGALMAKKNIGPLDLSSSPIFKDIRNFLI